MPESLTQKQTESLKENLRARHKVLSDLIRLELLKTGQQAHAELAGMVHDTKDESVLNALRNVDLAVVELHLHELDDIDKAERRIESGIFGQCTDCGEAIGYERLSAYPTAKRCIGCQSEYENRMPGR